MTIRLAIIAMIVGTLLGAFAPNAQAGGVFDYTDTAADDGKTATPVDQAGQAAGTKHIDGIQINGVTVPPGEYVVLGQDTSEARVQIKPGSSFAIKKGDTVRVEGSCSNKGTFTGGSVTVSP